MISWKETTMTFESMEQDFRRTVSSKVRLSAEGVNRFRVFTPFLLDDGDHPAIVLRKEGARWVLSDEGHTYMRLGDMDECDLHSDARRKTVADALSTFRLTDRKGELVLDMRDECHGEALYRFVQALLRISEVLS